MSRAAPAAAPAFLAAVRRSRVVAIVRRSFDLSRYAEVVSELVDGGIPTVELTIEQPHALEAIRQIAPTLDDEVWLGAGTIRSRADAARAVEAGARYLVSPSFDGDVATFARGEGVPYLPGVLTPTEVDAARAHGCAAVKLFPAGRMGTAYLEAIRAPLHDVAFVPTGGIGLDAAAEWLAAGGVAVGMGGTLVTPDDGPGDVRDRARRLVEAMHAAPAGD